MFAQNVFGHVASWRRSWPRTGLARWRSSPEVKQPGEFRRWGSNRHRLSQPLPINSPRSTKEATSPSKTYATFAYGQAKYIGILWMAYLARQYPDRRFITVSPGNTLGTHAPNDLALPLRMVAKYVMPRLGIAHKLDVGAKRLVDGVTDPTLSSGVFYASAAKKLKGPMVHQQTSSPIWPTRRFRTTPTKPSTASSPQRQSRNTGLTCFQKSSTANSALRCATSLKSPRNDGQVEARTITSALTNRADAFR